jgi:hypothetical protein
MERRLQVSREPDTPEEDRGCSRVGDETGGDECTAILRGGPRVQQSGKEQDKTWIRFKVDEDGARALSKDRHAILCLSFYYASNSPLERQKFEPLINDPLSECPAHIRLS